MTLENLLSQIGAGTKQITDRYSEYAGPGHDHDPHVFYAYEPSAPQHGHVATSKQFDISVNMTPTHGSYDKAYTRVSIRPMCGRERVVYPSCSNYGGSHKSGASMSALTLLAFLFFLHILQQCIKDHMTDMSSTQPVMVMTAGREGDDIISKTSSYKIDKTGITENNERVDDEKNRIPASHRVNSNEQNKIIDTNNSYDYEDSINKKHLLKVHTSTHEMKSDDRKHKYMSNKNNASTYFSGFVSAMDQK